MPEQIFEHDEWNYSPAKLPPQSKIELGDIEGIEPFDGVRNPGFRSSVAHRFWFSYQTAANNWQPKAAITESAAEAAVSLEVLISPKTHDVKFQPLTVYYMNENGKRVPYTHDMLATSVDGRNTLVFIRYGESLSKPKTWRGINAIADATPRDAAHDMIVINADHYSRQRRENLFRMHELVKEADEEADEIVLWTARKLKTLWLMRDLFPEVSLAQYRVFRACYRLAARKQLSVNLDHVLSEYSRVDVAA